MIQSNSCIIKNISINKVGNKYLDEPLLLSKGNVKIDDVLENILTKYFISPFNFIEFYSFYHNIDMKYNEVYSIINNIFLCKDKLNELASSLAKHLYDQSTHPKIKGGEFYVVYFVDFIIDGETVDAIGLFKSENKDTFLKVYPRGQGFEIESEKGININKLDKGCLIFNKEKENGYVVAVVDNTNKGVEAQYWIDNFLHIRSRKDEYSNTQNIMALAKNFVTKELPKENKVSTTEQINLLNKSLDFFKGKEHFDLNDFTNEVISQPETIKKFQQFKKDYEEANDLTIDNHFAISDAARKKQQRSYKRVIHLDKKIQIVIDGNCDHVEQGKDSKGKYYKVYYNEED